MKQNHNLTVIIPAKDEGDTLILLLNCLKNQSYKNFNIIVADNSNNNIVKDVCNTFGVVCITGGLPGKARNNGVKFAPSEYILFLDADIYIQDTFISDALESIQDLNADCLSFGFYAVTSSGFIKFLHLVVKYYHFITTKIGFSHGIGGAILVKRDVHNAIGGFDETITVLEDFDYFKRISKKFKYLFILRPFVGLNIRRILKEGVFGLGFKYICMDMYRIFFGEIRNHRIKYFD